MEYAKLTRVLACPEDHGELLLVDDELFYNPRLRLAYPIRDGVPILLASESRRVDPAEHDGILARTAAARGDA